MKIPRNIDGDELATRLSRYGYQIVHTTGSHQRLTTTIRGKKHTITIPLHRPLRVGTLNNILKDVAQYLQINRDQLAAELFG